MSEEERRNQAKFIIHAAAAASAGTAAVLSKKSLFGAFLKADTPILTAIAVGMVIALGKLFDPDMGSSTAVTLLSKYIGSGAEIAGAKSLVGWIPLIGNAANATITFGFMETLGWKIYSHFDETYEDKAAEPTMAPKFWDIPVTKKILITEDAPTPVAKKIPVT
ncbi:MAG: hypothetical protein WB392_01645 [Methanotrichaceae archaeon]